MKGKTQSYFSDHVILVGILLTLLAFLETFIFPWSPFITLYGTLAIIIPIVTKSVKFGSVREGILKDWKFSIGIFVLLIIWDPLLTSIGYQKLLKYLNLQNDVFYSLPLAVSEFISAASKKLHYSFNFTKLIFNVFLLVWMPIGEEFFYRGYLQGNLRKTMSFAKAVTITTALFALRHTFHLLLLYPNIPWGACFMWTLVPIGWGILLGYLYEKKQSLYMPIITHFLVNLIRVLFIYN